MAIAKDTVKEEIKSEDLAKEEDLAKKEVKVKGIYPTEYLRRNGIPYCETCGAQFQNTSDGMAVCPENFSSVVCPRLK